MNQEHQTKQSQTEEPIQAELHEESPYDAYGWQFHKWPLIFAAILTVVFYAFVFFYINV